MNSRLAARRVRLEEVVAVRLAQLVERPGFNLADALPRDAEDGADLLQRPRAPVVQAEAQSTTSHSLSDRTCAAGRGCPTVKN